MLQAQRKGKEFHAQLQNMEKTNPNELCEHVANFAATSLICNDAGDVPVHDGTDEEDRAADDDDDDIIMLIEFIEYYY